MGNSIVTTKTNTAAAKIKLITNPTANDLTIPITKEKPKLAETPPIILLTISIYSNSFSSILVTIHKNKQKPKLAPKFNTSIGPNPKSR